MEFGSKCSIFIGNGEQWKLKIAGCDSFLWIMSQMCSALYLDVLSMWCPQPAFNISACQVAGDKQNFHRASNNAKGTCPTGKLDTQNTAKKLGKTLLGKLFYTFVGQVLPMNSSIHTFVELLLVKFWPTVSCVQHRPKSWSFFDQHYLQCIQIATVDTAVVPWATGKQNTFWASKNKYLLARRASRNIFLFRTLSTTYAHFPG